MFKKSAQISFFENPCDGSGKGRSEDWFAADELPSNLMAFSTVSLEPGTIIGDHGHAGDSEVYQIVSGRVEYNDNGKTVVLGPGDVALCRDGEVHGMKDIGGAGVVFNAFTVKTATP